MQNDKKDRNKKLILANRINQTSLIDILIPKSGYDLVVYTSYLTRSVGWRQQSINWAQSKLPGSITIPDGKVFFTRSSLRNALAHGRGKLKLLTIPYIVDMLKNGVLFHIEYNNDFIFHNYVHRFIFEGETYFAIIIVREDFNGKRFYDNEFITKIADGSDYSQGQPNTRQITCAHPSTGSILRNILNVK